MNVNRKIIIAGAVITAAGLLRSGLEGKPLTPVLMGGYIFLLVLALVDVFGGPLAQLSGALAMLAVVYVMIDIFPWKQILAIIQHIGG